MIYKSAILGCGPRAAIHIQAYEGLSEIRLKAACDRDRTRLDDYGKRFSISDLYEDLEEMLKTERPDILHVVTPPNIREGPIELAARFEVKGVIVEKPIALVPSQAAKIKNIAQRFGIKIVVNMQRRYFKTCQDLKRVLTEKKIGDLVFVRCVTKGNILSMGPHMIDLLIFFLDDAYPTAVWACASGMNGYDYGHPAPANMMIRYTFPSQLTVYCEDASDAIGTTGETNFWQHLELDFWGTKGRAWWTQNRDWGHQSEDMHKPHIGKTCWEEDDLPGQREFTRALAHWLDDERKVHLNCLENALRGFSMIMGAFLSAWVDREVDLPAEVSDDVVRSLEEKLKRKEKQ